MWLNMYKILHFYDNGWSAYPSSRNKSWWRCLFINHWFPLIKALLNPHFWGRHVRSESKKSSAASWYPWRWRCGSHASSELFQWCSSCNSQDIKNHYQIASLASSSFLGSAGDSDNSRTPRMFKNLIEGLFRITFTQKKYVFTSLRFGFQRFKGWSKVHSFSLLPGSIKTAGRCGINLCRRGNPAHPGRALEDMYVSVCLCFKGFLFGKLCKGDKWKKKKG